MLLERLLSTHVSNIPSHSYKIVAELENRKIVYFSHGFSPVFKDLTKVDVPKDIEYVHFEFTFF